MAAFVTARRIARSPGWSQYPKTPDESPATGADPNATTGACGASSYMAALSSLKTEGPSRDFYDRKRAEHRIRTQALLALARYHVDVLWALLRDNRT
ncbi:transposase, IS900 [Mycobacteroides abscessus]|nr:transposase, IS900 [Mycobacteroides abscessus]